MSPVAPVAAPLQSAPLPGTIAELLGLDPDAPAVLFVLAFLAAGTVISVLMEIGRASCRERV